MTRDINQVLHHKTCICPECKDIKPLDSIVKNLSNRYVCIDCFVDDNMLYFKNDYKHSKNNVQSMSKKSKMIRFILG